MDVNQEEQKRNDFRLLLYDLSKSQELLKDTAQRTAMYRRLEQLYYSKPEEPHFRHFYSDVFSVLTSIQNNIALGDIAVLAQNLEVIRREYRAINYDSRGNKIDVSDCIRKLYDHVNLDLARIQYSNAGDWRVSQQEALSSIQAEVNGTKANIDAVKQDFVTEVTSVKDSIKDVQKEYITILAIFAAVVLAFTGGIAFSSSVLENIHKASGYRILLAALVVGLVLINILYGLFYYIECLVREKETHSVKPLIIANVTIVLLMLVICVAWFCGIAEKRDLRIISFSQATEELAEIDDVCPIVSEIDTDAEPQS